MAKYRLMSECVPDLVIATAESMKDLMSMKFKDVGDITDTRDYIKHYGGYVEVDGAKFLDIVDAFDEINCLIYNRYDPLKGNNHEEK